MSVSSRPIVGSPNTSTSPASGRLQADDRAHQHRLAGARPADHADDLAAPHVEVEPVVHDLVAEAVAQPAHGEWDRALSLGDGLARAATLTASRSQLKNTAKNASSTITMKIACTTAEVVRRPTCFGVALDLHALVAAGHADDQPEHRRLDEADVEVGRSAITSRSRCDEGDGAGC